VSTLGELFHLLRSSQKGAFGEFSCGESNYPALVMEGSGVFSLPGTSRVVLRFATGHRNTLGL
jgi:hypothetical protein